MAQITLKGNPCNTVGELPQVGSSLPAFVLTNQDLQEVTKENFAGSKLIFNIFPSVDTPVCATSVRTFNEKASKLDGVKVLCISQDLPFAAKRFCAADGIEGVQTLSGFRNAEFGKDYGILIEDGPLKGLFARGVVVADENGKVLYSELVSEIAEEPEYEEALRVVS